MADKLEDALDTDSWCQECGLETTEPVARQAVAMLRQQQAEIEALKAKTLTDEDIAKVVHELNQKARTPDRWVTAMEIGAETIIQLRDELAILREAQEK